MREEEEEEKKRRKRKTEEEEEKEGGEGRMDGGREGCEWAWRHFKASMLAPSGTINSPFCT